MKRLWLYTAFLLMGATGATNALAACPSSPLQNGTTANASQVMDWLDCKAPLDNPSFPGNVIINTALGISTGSPSGRLEIADSSQNAMAYISAFTTGAAQRAQLNLRKSATNTIGGLSPNAPGDTLGVISIWGVTSGGAWNDDAGGINVIQYGSAGSSRVGGTMNFFTGDGTAAANIRMSILGNGNIGIGTTAPSYTLDIAGGVNALRARAETTSASDAVAVFENSSAIQFIVRGNGNVGVGITSPSQKLDVAGSIRQSGCTSTVALYANGSGDIICNPSDARLKDIYGRYNGGLREIARITPVRFRFKALPRNPAADFEHAGFIAQDIAKIIPQAVARQRNGYYALDTTAILAASVNAIKELQAVNEQQNAVNRSLQRSLRTQSAELVQLKADIATLQRSRLARAN